MLVIKRLDCLREALRSALLPATQSRHRCIFPDLRAVCLTAGRTAHNSGTKIALSRRLYCTLQAMHRMVSLLSACRAIMALKLHKSIRIHYLLALSWLYVSSSMRNQHMLACQGQMAGTQQSSCGNILFSAFVHSTALQARDSLLIARVKTLWRMICLECC